MKRLAWTTNVVRGGKQFGDQPRATAPHLDYHQNDEARVEFHKENPIFDPDYALFNSTYSESSMLMGKADTDSEKLQVLLGKNNTLPITPMRENSTQNCTK